MKPPIADPFGAPPTQPHDHRFFRIDLVRSFITYFVFYLLTLPPIVLPDLGRDSIQDHLVFLGIISGAALFSAALGLCYPVEIRSTGLRGGNFWGARREVEWAQITRARWGWCLFPYVILSTSQQRNFIWLPLYLHNYQGFAHAIEEWAPADNLLRLWVQKRGV